MQNTLLTATAAATKKAADEKQAELLLARALQLEPFHVPTLTALAFVLLQRGSEGAEARAEQLLDKAVKCAGPRGEKKGKITLRREPNGSGVISIL